VGLEPARAVRSGFAGAQHHRLLADWLTSSVGPNAELRYSARQLMVRARDLEKNDALVRRYLALVAENVVGHRGQVLQSRNVLPDGRPNSQANDQIEAAWAEWGRPGECTMGGRQSFVEFQQQVVRAVARDGEALVRLVRGVGRYGLRVVMLDPDLFDDAGGVRATGAGTVIHNGVEVDGWGRPVAYHLWTHHLNETGIDRRVERIVASDVLHLTRPRRAGALRAESWLAPVLTTIRHRNGYIEAAVVNARTGAAKMGFVLQSEDAVGSGPDPDAAPQELEASPGVLERLAPGETFAAFDPDYPTAQFGPFLAAIDHEIAAGLGVSYTSLTGNLSQVNYSSIRAGLLTERDTWRSLQVWFADQLLTPLFEEWLRAAWASGALSLRMLPDQYRAHRWQARGWDWVDPLKDVQAQALGVAFGFTTRGRVVSAHGEDYEALLAEAERERDLETWYGATPRLPSGVISAEEDEDGATDEVADAAEDAGNRPRGAGHPSRGRGADSSLLLVRRAG
jgi:lambda family phage portal protein